MEKEIREATLSKKQTIYLLREIREADECTVGDDFFKNFIVFNAYQIMSRK